MKKLFLAAILAATASSAFANDRIENQIYSDSNFPQKKAQARQILESKGYQVGEIDADDHWSKPVLEIEAYKNNRKYDILMSYPNLKIIKESIDY
ncbi:PepSY domain-containing protein [Kingella kingae]|uniref:PepSY domain-containing protein n=1 Tax=Kingella kingae TaxID=504 RepID=UPI00041504F6|nr:PepSY domain-containing protein [Kingella kingae]MDK4529174.1 PepSY domain-containing protein [Kingella kingae]MDK4535300.1 PepSY domain-containing protein [Kingella kingae]MDK4536925.1 PepSY domain-containing protein [Kingella kingae]MDK4539267.1 PepSY domain-containing protein [Kingella kingae]MDK4541815.1 PepSY domain-containing protein [Kingella kingae]